MTREKQRIAIATACGWKCAGHPDQLAATGDFQFAYQFVINPNGEIVTHYSIPDYLTDLNAMHKAKKVLWRKGLMLEFVNQIVGITYSAMGFLWDKLTTDDHLILIANANAEQESEAFLRTLGLWEEEME